MAGTAGLEMQVDKDKQFLPSRTLYACEYTPSVTHRAYDSGVFSLSHPSGFIFKIYEEHRRAQNPLEQWGASISLYYSLKLCMQNKTQRAEDVLTHFAAEG